MGTFTISTVISTNALLIGFITLLALLLIALYFTSKNPNTLFRWTDLIIDPITNRGSLTRVLQLIGGMTGTFVIILEASKSLLTAEMFAIYLAALGVSEGFSKWVQLKYQPKSDDK